MLKKISFKNLLLIFSVLLIFLPDTYSVANYDYAIKSYDVNVSINKDNTYDITETINAVFKNSARELPVA